jgi:hypothetical protein
MKQPNQFLFGLLVGYLIAQRQSDQDKDRLLDFAEYQQRQIEELERYEAQLSLRLFYSEHPHLRKEI